MNTYDSVGYLFVRDMGIDAQDGEVLRVVGGEGVAQGSQNVGLAVLDREEGGGIEVVDHLGNDFVLFERAADRLVDGHQRRLADERGKEGGVFGGYDSVPEQTGGADGGKHGQSRCLG